MHTRPHKEQIRGRIFQNGGEASMPANMPQSVQGYGAGRGRENESEKIKRGKSAFSVGLSVTTRGRFLGLMF